MQYHIELLKADILEELHHIRRLEKEFSLSADKLDKSPGEMPFFDRAAIGYFFHSFYHYSDTLTPSARASSAALFLWDL